MFKKGAEGMEYEIIKSISALSENSNGWKKEVNLVSWNGRMPKVDIREWNEDHTKMSKGVTLTLDEAEQITMALHNFIAERRK